MTILIRDFHPSDIATLRTVFRSSVQMLTTDFYSGQERDAWETVSHDSEAWTRMMTRLAPRVAERNGQVAGYADLQPDGLIDHFYVSALHARNGVGTALMQALHDEAADLGIARLHAYVSLSAEGFFSRWGFVVQERRVVTRGDQALRNARMTKTIC